jgi:ribosomal protein S18 acetylase RimI-like enzyme
MVQVEYLNYPVGDSEFLSQIYRLLLDCDKEFLPPLSSRKTSYQSNLLYTSTKTEPTEYFNELLSQHFIIAHEDMKLLGFTSFRNNYECEELKNVGPSNYATTTCVSLDYRNKGVAQRLYKHLEDWIPLQLKLPYITRRTWSTNLNQIHLFEKLGYKLLHQLDNHRGQGIHTVYYGKPIECYIGA